ncbi:type III restriction-modification system endonuclease [Desulfonatronovibrio magnus]|uniref:type III restriction-modification system endonuclease n=1 Tax=Desulfonatronovibrio magnus TaxID=698827 RepID=UPI0005EB9B87|nr:DEAD/DEAH box helicase family protein [Desulfonatronovibrio magnus]
MKLKFKIQDFQTQAVQAVVDCFQGQGNQQSRFTLDPGNRDIGLLKFTKWQLPGFKNPDVFLTPDEVLENIVKVQTREGLCLSKELEGQFNLTVEMETGTGKTYVYIKTMFELFEKYGWGKYIVVVPSIAIREGVRKSFEMTEKHFMDLYGRKARYFIYNSKDLSKIDQFAGDSGINVMIINTQAFNARGKDARRIYMELDEFQSREPIDVIARTRPILIIDEPQSVEGKKTKEALKLFKPLFFLRYSATHREEYNKVFRLDALDAYNKKLVKKINVKGITVKGSTATDSYLYLEGIDLSKKHAPLARVELEVKSKSGVRRVLRKLSTNDNLYDLSGGLEQYKGYIVSQVNGQTNTVEFANGVILEAGDVQGDENEATLRRIQIRETIKSHLKKEKELFPRGIKVLSLFFIDEVAGYRKYDKDGNVAPGDYALMFQEEYQARIDEILDQAEGGDPYAEYLRRIEPEKTHNGYFSIDKKGRLTNPRLGRRETDSQDETAYDLIMKNKERLLSFAEPTRFIFSHSALKEGWDNPNVFQICTLKHSESTIKKRQEVGRGLRLCVNQDGDRIDGSVHGVDVHQTNVLSVIASESYESFVRELQKEIASTLSDRPVKADKEFFLGNVISNERQEEIKIDERMANKIYQTFVRNNYVDEEDRLTQDYFQAVEQDALALPDELKPYQDSVKELVSRIYDEKAAKWAENERELNVELKLNNRNFSRQEFQKLWKKINVKSAYTVSFESDELIQKSIAALNTRLSVSDLSVVIRDGELKEIKSKSELESGRSFTLKESQSKNVYGNVSSGVRYDLVGKIMETTRLTRKTILGILSGMNEDRFALFQKNPEDFIIKAGRIINEEKASVIIERITYNPTDKIFETDIFTQNTMKGKLGVNAFEVERHIYDHVITDSGIESEFVRKLDASKAEVTVYAKLPRGFFIPTPVGDYNPDWAIVFKEEAVKHVYFIAETKGSMNSLELRRIEEAKIHCARKHFEQISNSTVQYGVIDSYEKLLDVVR